MLNLWLGSIVPECNDNDKIGISNMTNEDLQKLKAPQAVKKPHSFTIHGETITDDYAWLRDNNWPDVKDQEVLQYLEVENSYYQQVMSSKKAQEEALYQELVGRIKLADKTVPIREDNYLYYSRTEENSNYSIYSRNKINDTQEEIILDTNLLAGNSKYFNLGAISVSPNHLKLAFSEDRNGAERFSIFVKNLENNLIQDEEISDTIGDICWHENNQGFFYTKLNDNWRSLEVYYHRLGEKQDQLIYQEQDELFTVSIDKSSTKRFLFIDTRSKTSNEIYYIDLRSEDLTPQLMFKRKEDHLYDVDASLDKFYIRTNDQGKNFRLITLDLKEPKFELAKEVIAYNPASYLTSFNLYHNYLVASSTEEGLDKIKIFNLLDNKNHTLPFPDPTYLAYVIDTPYESEAVRFYYSSLNSPPSVMEYDFASGQINILKVTEIPSGYDKNLYHSERIFATSQDGTKIPISLVYKKERFKKDGSNPLYLYGYGSYGYAVPASFRSHVISLLDRGFVYAIAHIRGGDDMGYEWYESAKFLTKRRTFDDFTASAKHLIQEKYTSKGNIVIAGGSAGGMLMGVCVNEHPELYKAVVAHVPFVDVLNTMLDDSLPLTPGEFKEWGNPKELDYFSYIKSYSPYDNIRKQDYPHMFVTAGISDPRVTYWEPAKWVAKLREYKTDSNILLLETNMDAGHAGASGRFGYLLEIAKEYNFILKVFGL
jgi:oligopeptidase B